MTEQLRDVPEPDSGDPDTRSPMLVGLLDGTVLPASTPLIRPDDAGIARGDGIFESTLVVDGQVRDLPQHLARLARSARMTDLVLPEADAWTPAVDALVAAWTGGGEMVIRLVVTRGPEQGGPTCYVTAAELPASSARQRTSGVRVLLLDRGISGSAVATSPWLLAGAKTLSYAVNMAALRYAAANDADDVIFVGSDGAVLEGPTSTVVIAKDRTLLTPPLEGVLDGITVVRLIRAAQTAGWATAYRRMTPDDLAAADGVWLASSARLLAPVRSIDAVERTDGGLTRELLTLLEAP
ncbi:4-amino-4-deoxychorismate lyase [Nakamurella sp. UYEF19]|uniref:aminotransferase class IV n=1 Tax=Nakamurella sp. UYEF19 TaxID=1756392 RepID=UPI003390E779